MIVTIQIDTDNDAFQPDPDYEVGRLLQELGQFLWSSAGTLDFMATVGDPYFFEDYNGNMCGRMDAKERNSESISA